MGLICTGFHRQNQIKKTQINQTTSICFNGFGVSLHWRTGVGSQSLYDVHAWAYSCNHIETNKITAKKT